MTSTSKALNRLLSTNEIPSPWEAAALQAEVDELLDRISRLKGQVRRCRGALSAVRHLPVEILGEIFIWALLHTPPDSDYRRQLIHFNLVCKSWRQAALMCHRLWSRIRVESGDASFLPIYSWMARSGSLPKKLEFYVPPEDESDSEQDEDEGKEDEGEPEDREDEEEEDEDEPEGGSDDEEEEDEGRGGYKDAGGIGAPNDVIVQLLTHGVPLDDLGLEFRGTEDLERLLDSLGDRDTSSKARPWDCIKTLSLSFKIEGWVEPDAMGPLLLRLPETIKSFELCFPQSRHLSIDDPLFKRPLLRLSQVFAENLTSLSITCDWGIQHMYGILEHCANLEVLTFNFQYDTMRGCRPWTDEYFTHLFTQDAIPLITLPKVHTLRVRESPFNFVSLLHWMEVPLVTNVDFEFEEYGEMMTVGQGGDDLLAFLTTTIFNGPRMGLKSLRLSGQSIHWSVEAFVRALDKLPALTYLAVENVDFGGDELIRQLDRRCRVSSTHGDDQVVHQPEPFLPNLKVLRLIGDYRLGPRNLDNLVSFISSREQLLRAQPWSMESSGSDGRLKELTVSYVGPEVPGSERRWQALERSGMVLDIFPW